MVEDKYVLIPWYPISYLMIAGYGFFGGGRLRVPTRRCDLVVPADWGWGRSNKSISSSGGCVVELFRARVDSLSHAGFLFLFFQLDEFIENMSSHIK